MHLFTSLGKTTVKFVSQIVDIPQLSNTAELYIIIMPESQFFYYLTSIGGP